MEKTKNSNFMVWLAAILLFIMMKPYFAWHGVFADKYVTFFLRIFLGVIFALNFKKVKGKDAYLFSLLIVITIFFTIICDYNLFFYIGLLPIVFIPFAKERFNKQVFDALLRIYVFFMFFGLMSWFLYLLGAMPSLHSIPPLNSLKPINYTVYPFFVVGQSQFRFFGVFDEPGVVGTISGILLCIKGIKLRDKFSVILLLSGLCSLSFFFYFILAAYFIIQSAFVERKTWKTIILTIFLVIGFFIIQSSPFLYEVIGARFEWDSDAGKFAGDNRIYRGWVEDAWAAISGSSQMWFGINDKEGYLQMVEGSSSFFSVVILYGLAFVILYVAFFILYKIRYRRTFADVLTFIIVFVAVEYQRPDIFCFWYIFLFCYFAQTDFLSDTHHFSTFRLNNISTYYDR